MIAVIGPNWEADLERRGLKRRGAELCVRFMSAAHYDVFLFSLDSKLQIKKHHSRK